MLYRAIHNPSHSTFRQCLKYMLRAGDGVRVHHEVQNFGALGNQLDDMCRSANALAPLTAELGNQPRANTRPFRHAVLSLAPGEELSDREMCEVSREVMAGLARKYDPQPQQPNVIAVHRDTDKLHTHMLSVPVDLQTGRRVHLPQNVQAYRKVLDPIEARLGLQTPNVGLGWNDYRFHLPFSTWARMDDKRVADLRGALLESDNWVEAMRRLSKWGVAFRETSKAFSPTVRFFLTPYGSTRRDKGMAIQRDLFKGLERPPTATACVSKWGAFPRQTQIDIEKRAKPVARFRKRAIGGERGELLYRRWETYAAKQREMEGAILLQFDSELDRLRHASPTAMTLEERKTVRQPQLARKQQLAAAKPMTFSNWVEYHADRGDQDARWLSAWGERGANMDPALALKADREGELSDSGDGANERERYTQLVNLREAQRALQLQTQLQKQEEESIRKRRNLQKRKERALSRPLKWQPGRARQGNGRPPDEAEAGLGR